MTRLRLACLQLIGILFLFLMIWIQISTHSFPVIKLYNTRFLLVIKFISNKRVNNPWITSAILNSNKFKRKLFKKYKEWIVTHNIYRQDRNYLTHVVRITKCNYFMNIFNNFKYTTKKIWQTINELKGNWLPKTSMPT